MKKIDIDDSIYPNRLKSIPNAPKILYLEGNTNLLSSNSIAIIGSRYATENGKKLAEKFATELSQIGLTIISGLALGIDTVAHTFSYNQKGKTIAVLGCGFDNIFPEENKDLYNKILENDGLVISEYPPNVKKKSEYFTQRNRIICGLSIGVLVVEAQYRSGTGVTARYAKFQKRPIFTLPHEIWDSNGVGTNKLLKKGAILVTDTEDILKTLKLRKYHVIYNNLREKGNFESLSNKSLRKMFTKKEDFTRCKEKINCQKTIFKDFSNKQKNTSSKIIKMPSFINDDHAKVYEFIYNISKSVKSLENTYKTASVNEISHSTGYSIEKVQSILFMLEIDGAIKKVSGGYVCI